jgi:WD40 repeat protein
MLDSQNIVLGFQDGKISIYSLTTDTLKCTASTQCTLVLPFLRGFDVINETLIVAAYCGRAIYLWDNNCQQVASTTSPFLSNSNIVQVITPNLVAFGTLEGAVLLYDAVNNFASMGEISTGSLVFINSLALNGQQLMAGASNGKIYFMNYLTMTTTSSVVVVDNAPVVSIAVFNTTFMGAVCQWMNFIYIVRMDSSGGSVVQTWAGHTSNINSLAYEWGVLLSGSSDTTVKVWDSNNGNLKRTINYGTDVYSLMLLNNSGE